MRSLLKTILIAALILGCTFSEKTAAEDHLAESPVTFALEQNGQRVDGPTLAYQLMRSFLTEKEWKSECRKIKTRFKDWEAENIGGMDRYLNDRFVIVALGAAGGEVDKIKKGIIWLAFYKEFRQRPPSLVYKFLDEHQGSMTELMTDFTWKKASRYVVNKTWREDLNKDSADTARDAKAAPKPDKPVEVAVAPAPKVAKTASAGRKKAESAPREIAVAKPMAMPEAFTLASTEDAVLYGAPRPAEIPLNDDDR